MALNLGPEMMKRRAPAPGMADIHDALLAYKALMAGHPELMAKRLESKAALFEFEHVAMARYLRGEIKRRRGQTKSGEVLRRRYEVWIEFQKQRATEDYKVAVHNVAKLFGIGEGTVEDDIGYVNRMKKANSG
jgi:hypothetical protein